MEHDAQDTKNVIEMRSLWRLPVTHRARTSHDGGPWCLHFSHTAYFFISGSVFAGSGIGGIVSLFHVSYLIFSFPSDPRS